MNARYLRFAAPVLALVLALETASALKDSGESPPTTVCATKLTMATPLVFTCLNECAEHCQKDEVIVGTTTWTSCSCKEGYSSACCQLVIGQTPPHQIDIKSTGSCLGSCGNGGGCTAMWHI